jgi:stage V sporulation protein R
VRPTGQGERASLEINPYHLGFSLWERVVEEHGVEYARRVMQQNDDFAFIRGYLTSEAAAELSLFRFKGPARGPYQVEAPDIDALHEALLRPKFSFGAPTVMVERLRVDGTLELVHDHATDGRGLDHERSARVLDYLVKIWRRPIVLTSVDGEGRALQLTVAPA